MTPGPTRTTFDRDVARQRLATEEFDVLVIGGGITGAGVALDAAARGLRTALVERDDFASGTSSKSSKLVHGGLRYLQQKEYRLVYENLAERQRLLENAPHLVRPLPFLIPLFGKDGVVSKSLAKAYSTALWLYDLTGGVRIGKRHQRLTLDETLAHMPTLRADRLVAGFLYYDAQADDARLTLAIARTAVLDHGAVAANYTAVTGLLKEASGRVVGACLDDGIEVRAGVVINASGVWVDEVRALESPAEVGSLRPAKGVHITVPWAKVRCDIAAVLPVPKDRRSIFVVPWGDFVYVGTTDTDYDGSIDDPQCTEADVDYLLGAVNTFVTEPLSRTDILGTWAGLRPLVAAAKSERTADLSRRHAVSTTAGGMITVTGGKLTTYRKMAADTVDLAVRTLGRGPRRSPTRNIRLRGAAGYAGVRDETASARLGVSGEWLEHLAQRYGGEARTIVAMIDADPALGQPLVEGLPYLRAEAVYAVRYEMAQTLTDVLARRTRALLLARDDTCAAATAAGNLIAPELRWSPADVADQVRAFVAVADASRTAAGLPPVHLAEATVPK